MITDRDAVNAFEVLHDYCDERECTHCIFLDKNRDQGNMCVLRNNNPAYLRADVIPVAVYKINSCD